MLGFIVVLAACNNEDDMIKYEGARLATRIYVHVCRFFRHPRADNTVVSGVIWQKCALTQAFMHALVTCMNEEDTIKNEDASAITTFLSLYMGIFQVAQGQVTTDPQPVFGSGRISKSVVLVTCKTEEDLIKNKGARMATILYVDFSDAQGQMTA